MKSTIKILTPKYEAVGRKKNAPTIRERTTNAILSQLTKLIEKNKDLEQREQKFQLSV